jgi:hypothetical protein
MILAILREVGVSSLKKTEVEIEGIRDTDEKVWQMSC